jgi:hypothetical protein
MAVNAILLDTNAYVAFKQGQPDAVEIVQRATLLDDGHFQAVDGLRIGATPTDLLLP